MRKIKLLLVAVLAMVGLSAFAQAPADQATGYLYDAAGKKFINAEGAVGLTGMEFKALKQGTSKDYTTKDGTNRKFTSYRFKTLDGQHGLGVDNTNSTTLANNGIVTSTGTYGYGVFAVVPEEGQGFRIMSTYNRADFNVDYLYDYCLGYKADGTLFCFPEAEAPYWQFVDGETYKTTVAANAMPNANDVGYLYNLATKQFISADAVMDDNGVEFVIGEKVACGNHFGSEGKYIEEAGYSYIRFKLNGTSNYMRMINEGVTCKNSGYHKWATIGTEKGLVIRCIYVPSQVASAQQGYYLTPDAEGNLVLLEEPTDASLPITQQQLLHLREVHRSHPLTYTANKKRLLEFQLMPTYRQHQESGSNPAVQMQPEMEHRYNELPTPFLYQLLPTCDNHYSCK